MQELTLLIYAEDWEKREEFSLFVFPKETGYDD